MPCGTGPAGLPGYLHWRWPGARQSPPPAHVEGDDRVKARLTSETWRLDTIADGGCQIEKLCKLDDGTAIDFPTLLESEKKHGIKFLKAMECRGRALVQSQGLWEGVPLREVLRLVGKVDNVMRVYWSGFHNNDPKQLFQSSASYTQVVDSVPGEVPGLSCLPAQRWTGFVAPWRPGGDDRARGLRSSSRSSGCSASG